LNAAATSPSTVPFWRLSKLVYVVLKRSRAMRSARNSARLCSVWAEKSGPSMPPWPQIVPLFISPYLRNTAWPDATSSAVKTTSPPGATDFAGIGGALS